MNLPANVSIAKQGAKLVLTTPFHSAVVEWAHQNGGRWNGEWRAWVVDDSPGQAERFAALVSAIWPDGVATNQGRSGPRRAVTAGRAISTAGSVEMCPRCKAKPIYGSGIIGVNLAVCPECWSAIVDYVRAMDANLLVQAGQSPAVAPSPVSREQAQLQYPVCRFCGRNAPTLGTPAAVVGMCLDCEKFGHGNLMKCADPTCTCNQLPSPVSQEPAPAKLDRAALRAALCGR